MKSNMLTNTWTFSNPFYKDTPLNFYLKYLGVTNKDHAIVRDLVINELFDGGSLLSDGGS